MISRRKICGIHMGPLMDKSPLISLRQGISRTKNIVRQHFEFVGLRHGCTKPKN